MIAETRSVQVMHVPTLSARKKVVDSWFNQAQSDHWGHTNLEKKKKKKKKKRLSSKATADASSVSVAENYDLTALS